MTASRVSDATGRLQLRRRLTRRQRLLWLAAAVALAAILGGLVWLVTGSSVLAARTVTVTGTKVLTADEVRAVAAVEVGRPLVWVDPGAVADRVAALAPVDRVSVRRAWPSAVSIEVTERKPLFVVESGVGYVIVDAAGVAFQAVAAVPTGLVPAQASASDTRLLRDIGTVLGSLDGGLLGQVRRVRADTPDSIVLELRNGAEIMWGSADQSALKLQVVTQLMRQQKATRYDVSAPSNPVTR